MVYQKIALVMNITKIIVEEYKHKLNYIMHLPPPLDSSLLKNSSSILIEATNSHKLGASNTSSRKIALGILLRMSVILTTELLYTVFIIFSKIYVLNHFKSVYIFLIAWSKY